MWNLYIYKLSRDEVRGLLEHYKSIGRQWAERPVLLLAIGAIVLASGVSAQQTNDKPSACPTPRPGPPCPQPYRRAPVCGIKADGSKLTYSDFCQACSQHDVASYTFGACEDSKGE